MTVADGNLPVLSNRPEVRPYNGGFALLEWLPDNRPERLNMATGQWEKTPQGAQVQVITRFAATREQLEPR